MSAASSLVPGLAVYLIFLTVRVVKGWTEEAEKDCAGRKEKRSIFSEGHRFISVLVVLIQIRLK